MISPLIVYTGQGLLPVVDSPNALTSAVTLPCGVTYAAGTVLGQIIGSGVDVNEVQTMTFTNVSSGTFNIGFDNEYTTAIASGATAATVQAAMQLLPSLSGTQAGGDITVTGGPVGTAPLVFTFNGTGTTAGKHQPLLTVTNGTNGTIAVSLTTLGCPAGGYFDAYSAAATGVFGPGANGPGLTLAKQILQYPVRTNSYGQVFFGSDKNKSDNFHFDRTAPSYFSGTFRCSDLIGLDANAVPQLGVLISGSTVLLTSTTTILRIG